MFLSLDPIPFPIFREKGVHFVAKEKVLPQEVASPSTKEVAPPKNLAPHLPRPLLQAPTPSEPSPTPAGKLSRYISSWHSVTNNSFILNIVKSGYKINVNRSILKIPPAYSRPSQSKLPIVREEVKKLITSGVISEIFKGDSSFQKVVVGVD